MGWRCRLTAGYSFDVYNRFYLPAAISGTMPMLDDRRKEPGHVLVGIEAALNGVPCAIIDISRSGVLLVRPTMMPADS